MGLAFVQREIEQLDQLSRLRALTPSESSRLAKLITTERRYCGGAGAPLGHRCFAADRSSVAAHVGAERRPGPERTTSRTPADAPACVGEPAGSQQRSRRQSTGTGGPTP